PSEGFWDRPALCMIMAAWSAAHLAPISRPAPLCLASKAIGIIPQSIPAPPPACNNWLATARGRAGYAADRVLLYATAGGAFANGQTNFTGPTTSHPQSGWTAGGGIEWAFADNWTAKVEYLYVNLGNTSVNCVNAVCTAASSLSVTGVPPGPAIPVSIGLTENLIRAGVNYKFSWWPRDQKHAHPCGRGGDFNL